MTAMVDYNSVANLIGVPKGWERAKNSLQLQASPAVSGLWYVRVCGRWSDDGEPDGGHATVQGWGPGTLSRLQAPQPS